MKGSNAMTNKGDSRKSPSETRNGEMGDRRSGSFSGMAVATSLKVMNLIRKATNRVYSNFYRHMPGLILGENVVFWGMPLIDVRNGGRILIGDNTKLISTNHGTHVNYGAPAKLMAIEPGSEIEIGHDCSIGGASINAYGKITVGDYTGIGTNSNVFDTNGHPIHLDQHSHRRGVLKEHEPVVIGANVWVTLNCVVLPGTSIGDGTIVACNSVVRGTVPEYSIVSGNPAVVVGEVRRKKEG